MFELFKNWYQSRFSDPNAVALVAILLVGFIILYGMGHLITPLLVAIVLAYLLEWPINQLMKLKFPRMLALVIVLLSFISLMLATILGVLPTIWRQVSSFVNDIPKMYGAMQVFIASLPERFPEIANVQLIETLMHNTQQQVLNVGETVLKNSMASLLSAASLAVYLVLVPLLLFFLLKDKEEMMSMFTKLLPKNRALATKVWHEMNSQISNYIRGKVVEILVVTVATYIVFIVFDLRYPLLLAVAVGFSVLIPYIGAVAVTVPVMMVGLSQWGLESQFYWMMISYGIIQMLDGNVLVPILFSEAVNLHPVVIIVSVLVFGGIWGFWGVFFAIPLATLVKAVLRALPSRDDEALIEDVINDDE